MGLGLSDTDSVRNSESFDAYTVFALTFSCDLLTLENI